MPDSISQSLRNSIIGNRIDSLHGSSKIVLLNISRSSIIMRNIFFQTDKTVLSKYKYVTTYQLIYGLCRSQITIKNEHNKKRQ